MNYFTFDKANLVPLMRNSIQLITFLIVVLLMNVNFTTAQQPSTNISLDSLEGKWYIHYSNFPMWTKGDKQYPNFNYTTVERKDESILLDVVEYKKNGNSKTIKGKDKILNSENSKFKWRGKGLLWFFVSKWEIVYFDESTNWAIIKFEKTFFTPAGYDVISKSKVLDDKVLQAIDLKLSEIGLKEELSRIPQL